MIEIEFFHDVICSFCFPMSYRMRQLNQKYKNITITHRSFALGWEVSDFEAMFGSHDAVKEEVLEHWRLANENDDEHRFNIEGMKAKDFNFPHSQPGLIAAKAAGILNGEQAYWELFDKLQEGLFIRNLDISDESVIHQLVQETSLDFAAWQTQFKLPETKEAVLADLSLAQTYGLQGVPALIINQQFLLSGAQTLDAIEEALEKAARESGMSLELRESDSEPETPTLQILGGLEGASCRVENGIWICD